MPANRITPVTVFASAALTAALQPTQWVYCPRRDDTAQGRQGILEMLVRVNNIGTGPITEITTQFEYTEDDPAAGAVGIVPVEQVSFASGNEGDSTVVGYTAVQDITGRVAPFLLRYAVSFMGVAMRMQIQASTGTPTSSAVVISAIRRY